MGREITRAKETAAAIVNVNGMDPQGTTGAEITTIDRRNVTRITTDERRYSKHWDCDRREEGGSKGERPVMTEERDERTEQVRITLSFLMFSAAYNVQRVRYRHAHVPDGGPPRDNGLGREDMSKGEI